MNVTGAIRQKSCIFEWEISNFLSLPKKVGEVCYSPEFEFGGGTWTLNMYPNGINERSKGMLSLYLGKLRSNCSKHIVCYKLSVKDKDGQNFESKTTVKHVFNGNGSSWGWSAFMLRSNLLEKIVKIQPDNVLIVSCSVSWDCCVAEDDQQTTDPSAPEKAQLPTASCITDAASSETERRNCTSHVKSKVLLETLSRNLKDYFLNQRKCDAIIKVKDQEFPVHRMILEARSSVFAAVFEYDTVENHRGIVEISDVDPDVFRDILLYMYSGKMEELSTANVFKIYGLAHQYQLKELKQVCMKFIESSLSVETVCDVFLLADKYNEVQMDKFAKAFLGTNKASVLKNATWKAFENEHHLLAFEVLKSILLDNA